MNREDSIAMAREAGFAAANYPSLVADEEWATLERFAALVAAAAKAEEREACAKVAERFEPDEKLDYVTYASTAIRARGQA